MKNIMKAFLLALVLIILISFNISASDITKTKYSGTITIQNNSGSTAAGVILPFTLNTSSLITNGMLNSSLTNSSILDGSTDVAYMPQPGTNNWWINVPTINPGTSSCTLYTGGSTATSSDIVYFPGSSGMTTADNANLELGNNFLIELKGYLNANTNGSIIKKGEAYLLGFASNKIYSILDQTNTTIKESNTTYDLDIATTYGPNYYAQTFTTTSSYYCSGFILNSSGYIGSSTMNYYLETTSGGKPTGTKLTSGSKSTITSIGENTYYFDCPVYLTNGVMYALVLTNPSGNASNYSYLRWNSTSSYANGSVVVSGDSGVNWAIVGPDFYFKTLSNNTVLETGVLGSGEHTIKYYADTTNNKIDIDGFNVASMLLGGLSVPDNSNSIISFTNDVCPYIRYQKIYVNGTLQQDIECATSISVQESVFTDRSGNSHSATPTFITTSTNASVSAALSNFQPIVQAKNNNSGSSSSGEIIQISDSSLPSQMFTELNTQAVPGADIITAIFGVSGTPVALWWFPFLFIGIAILSLLVYEATASGGTAEGSLLTQSIVIEVLLAIGGLIGSATGHGGMIPFWPVFLFPIPAVALIFSRRHMGWG